MPAEKGVEEAFDARRRWETAEAPQMGPTKGSEAAELAAPEDAPMPPPARPFVPDLGPVGPWAFGRTEWNPTSGLTGIRPVVDRHSVTRCSPADWLRQNAELTASATASRQRGDAELDALHRDSSDRLQERAQHVWRWRAELERAAEIMRDEVQMLMQTPPRLHRVLAALAKAASVASECILVRCKRPDTDLVRDHAHDELVREAALVREVAALVQRCLGQAGAQLRADRAALAALQADWSCKQDCYRVDTLARAVTAHREPLVGTFQPGAAAIPDRQVTPDGWEQSTRRNIAASEAERSRSIAYRTLLQPLLDNAVRDVRAQAARVDDALARNVALVARAVEHFDEQYRLVSSGVCGQTGVSPYFRPADSRGAGEAGGRPGPQEEAPAPRPRPGAQAEGALPDGSLPVRTRLAGDVHVCLTRSPPCRNAPLSLQWSRAL
ncbi:hypothetical protein ONE63_009055 [Megalurothrips usitatus]|uniref:Tektin n=1 Tax=Megalurothrips usitatus TaxID=439358 RepID=A0AAV7XMK5_9NEOP|nr:hypothetical protein ONE63_009055 [Megalurothrips usitatus]